MKKKAESSREKRKDEHIKFALKPISQSTSHFDQISFIHHSLPNIGVEDVSLNVKIPNLFMSNPLYINAMTGGSVMTGNINAALAEVACSTGMAMAVGSQHAGLNNKSLIDTYKVVRKVNPKGTIIANVGADVSLEFALRAVDMIEANALQIHLNAPQELIMPEGSRNFTGWLKKIEHIIQHSDVPVILKEVGFGMCRETYTKLKEIGIEYIDVGGRGGTNFIEIENHRRGNHEYGYLKGWGQTTPISLLEAQEFLNHLTIFASGGVRHPLDVVKSLALGAKAVGIASPILRILNTSGTKLAIEEMEQWKNQIKVIFTMLGARNVEELQTYPLIFSNEVKEWCEARKIDTFMLSNRVPKSIY